MLIFNNDISHGYIDHLSSFIFNDSIISDEQICFENSYMFCGNIETKGEIIANYDLYVIGNIKGLKLRVKKNLYVLGNIDVDEIVVQGDLFCKKNMNCRTLNVGGNTHLNLLHLKGTGNIGKNLIVNNTMIIEGSLTATKEIYCFEGIIGKGNCEAQKIIVKEFFDLMSDRDVIILDNLDGNKAESPKLEDFLHKDIFNDDKRLKQFSEVSELMTTKLIELFEHYLSTIENKLEFDEIGIRFYEIQKILPQVNSYLDNYKQVLRIANLSKIETIEDFILILSVKHTAPKFLYKISIVDDVLNYFFNDQKKSIKSFKLQNKDRTNIVNNLYFLEKAKHLLSNQEFRFLYQQLVSNLLSEEK